MQRAERIPKDFRGTADKCQIIYTALTKLRTAKNFRNINKAPTMFTTIEYPRHTPANRSRVLPVGQGQPHPPSQRGVEKDK